MIVFILKTEDGFQTLDFPYDVPADPLEEGNFLLPAVPYAETEPPAVLENEIAVYAEGNWQVVPNIKGTIYWLNGVEHVIEVIGQTLPPGASLTPPVQVPEAISTAQGQLALLEYGKYQAAVDFIEAITDPIAKLKAEINFYRRNTWERDNQTLLALAQGLGITNEELDQMFIFGSTQ